MSSRTSSCAHKLHYFLADTFSSFFFIRSHKEIMSRGQLQSGAGSSNSNAYSLDLTSLAPGKALLTIPSLSRGSECVITVRLSKADTDITVLCPYFEAYTPASSGALAAADALRVKQPATPPEEGPPTAYVSEFQHNNAGLNMYFAVSPHEATNLTSYDWVECLSHSRGQRFSRPPISASSPLKAPTESQGGKLIGVGAPEEEDGVEEGCQTTAGAGTSSKEHDSSKSLIPLSTTAATDNGVVFGISNVRNVFYIALHAPVTLRHVEVTILSHVPLRAQDDIRHPLRMCRLHHVTGETYDTAVEWITRKRTSLQQGLLSLTQDGCEAPLGSSKRRGPDGAPLPESRRTFLHVIAENLGDPRFARMLVRHCSRFLRKDEKDVATHRTALQTLFLTPLSSSSSSSSYCTVKDWYARTVDAFSAGYYRMLELLRLLVEEVQVSLDEEDCLGNTAVHYAACGHRRGSELLPILLMMGAPPTSINLDGHTPKQELLLRQRQQGLMTWDVDEALALLEKYTDQPFAPVAMGDDSITSAPYSRAAAQPQDSASVDAVALLVAAPQSLNHEASVAAALQKRRDDVAVHIGQGVDLPRVPLKLVDVVPLKVRPLGADAIRAFPTPAIDVDETGYPAHNSKHHAVMDDVISSRGGDALETTTTASEGLMPTRTMAGDDGDDDGSHHNRGSISDATLKLLRAEFNALDHDSEGWIPVSDMRRVYLSYDGYGVAESTAEIDKMISVMGIRKDGKVTFDEYCILMLRMNRL